MFRLLPRDENFFNLFEQQAGHIVSASRVLEELTLDYPAAQSKVQQIRDLEHAGDAVTHETPTEGCLIKWKELYETMEAVTDRCEDVLNVIEGITLKMA